MAGANGYFQLLEEEGKAYLRVIPPKDGGVAPDVKEVMAYLEDVGYQGYDLRELNRAITQDEKEEQVYIGAWSGFHEQEKIKINVSRDYMLVYARFYPPSNRGRLMDFEGIKDELLSFGIKTGVQEKVIKDYIANREYCKDFLIAKGIPPIQGKDARIEYFFNTNTNLKPKRNEDGTVDYRQLDTINHVEAGQRIAKLIREVPGQSGKNVYGEDVPARQVKTRKLSYANHIRLSEDETELFSEVTGHVSLVQNKIFVADVYEIPADVDNATGNVIYDGNVQIKGNVKSGFMVKAKGDIVVEGVVEGAALYAKGQIIVKRGIHGMAKGVLKAGSNIITKFIESATVTSEGYIETESILHSNVSARTEIRVGGKKGFITGGVIRAGNLVDAQNVGSAMGAATKIEVGVDPEDKERYNELQKEIGEIQKEMERIRPVLKNFAAKAANAEGASVEKQMQQIQTLAKNYKEKQQRLNSIRKEYSRLQECMSHETSAKVKIRGTIYAGVSIGISDMGINIKSNYSCSRIYKEKGEIVIRPL